MPFSTTTRRVLAGVITAVTLLATAAAALIWHAADATATAPTLAVAAGPAAVEPSTTSTTRPTTTSSSTTTAPTTSTTKPKPVPTTVRVRATVPATTPPTAAPATTPPRAPVSASASPEERCAAALKWVGEHGLALPAGWGFRCPGEALVDGKDRWGVACWNCNGDMTNWIAVDVGRVGSSDITLHYVVAHEICHAIDYTTLGDSSEVGADLCAALHGAPRP
jgi:hypothetical protein